MGTRDAEAEAASRVSRFPIHGRNNYKFLNRLYGGSVEVETELELTAFASLYHFLYLSQHGTSCTVPIDHPISDQQTNIVV